MTIVHSLAGSLAPLAPPPPSPHPLTRTQSLDPCPLCPARQGCGFKLGHLTQQSAAWALLGMNLGSSFSPAAQLKDSDELLVVAYPSFNPRGAHVAQQRPDPASSHANPSPHANASPSAIFSATEELCAARSLWDAVAADPSGPPFVLFNAELDRLRGGYYPSLFFPELARLTHEWLPQVRKHRPPLPACACGLRDGAHADVLCMGHSSQS